MKRPEEKNDRQRFLARKGILFLLLVLIILVLAWFFVNRFDNSTTNDQNPAVSQSSEDWNRIENGIHVRTGLKEDEGLMTVVTHCTACHSARLVIQNRMNKERWDATIRWMQETQNLWDLGENQEIIVDYLVRNYPPTEKGRRENLKNTQWYELND
jgi:hypothetical protein